MNATRCPSSGQLANYLLGHASQTDSDTVETHLTNCRECQRAVAEMGAASDSVVMGLRQPPPIDTDLDEPQYRQALERLRALASAGSNLNSEVTEDFKERTGFSQIGPYRVLAKLGEGGMGTVYKAVHSKLGQTVAVKVLHIARNRIDEAVSRFEREMQAIGRLQHSNIVRALHAGEDAGIHFLAMEYVDGIDLSELLRRLGRLPIPEACELVRQAACGLQYAHQHSLVHRDIKPSNLMVATDGQVKILDLGLALCCDESVMDDEELTSTDQVMGTFDYMAPEQCMDSHDVDIRADIYSLGATLYKLLSGKAPFAGGKHDTPPMRIIRQAVEQVRPIREQRPDVPASLAAVLHRMLAKAPEQRFSVPAEVVAALEPFVQGCDLPDLVPQAQRQAAAADLSEASTGPVHSAASTNRQPRIQPALAPSSTSGSRWKHWAVAAVLLPLVFAFGIVIWIERNGLRTKLVVPDGSQIELSDGGGQVTVTLPPIPEPSETVQDPSRRHGATGSGTARPRTVPPANVGAKEQRPASTVVLTPLDLRPGDTYHLAFVTSKTLDAVSANIAVYNKFVQTLADDAGLGKSRGWTWHAVASTPTVDARDNAPITGPVYDLRGYRLADDASDMWDNSVPIPFNIDEHGFQVASESVYTGTKNPGVAEDGFELGNSGGTGRSRLGNTGLVDRPLLFNWSEQTTPHHFYAISEKLVVSSGSSQMIQSPAKTQVKQPTPDSSASPGAPEGVNKGETSFGPTEAYLIDHSVTMIIKTDPQEIIPRYGIKLTSEQFKKIASADRQYLGQETPYGYQVFCFPNRGPILLTWIGYADGNGQIGLRVWDGSEWKQSVESYRRMLKVLEPTTYSEAVYRPSSEEMIFVLANCTSGRLYTDAIYCSIRSEQGDR